MSSGEHWLHTTWVGFCFAMRALAAICLILCAMTAVHGAESPVVLPAPLLDDAATQEDVAVIAGGCFWGIQAVYQHTEGVIQAVSGYSGGTKQTAHYEIVATGQTGHAEAVQIRFNQKKMSYGKILRIFFSLAHDPTQFNRQGPDVGPQYRSAIFYANDAQRKVAEAYIRQLDAGKFFGKPIVTRVDPLEVFYPAEDYHQDYATLHPGQPYILYHDLPKIESLKKLMPELYRANPVLFRAAAHN